MTRTTAERRRASEVITAQDKGPSVPRNRPERAPRLGGPASRACRLAERLHAPFRLAAIVRRSVAALIGSRERRWPSIVQEWPFASRADTGRLGGVPRAGLSRPVQRQAGRGAGWPCERAARPATRWTLVVWSRRSGRATCARARVRRAAGCHRGRGSRGARRARGCGRWSPPGRRARRRGRSARASAP